jgi:ketosteroid isomerase-like protein
VAASPEAVVHAYAACADGRDQEGFTALWTDDAVFEVVREDGAVHSAVGPVAIWERVRTLDRYDRTEHVVNLVEIEVEVDADRAAGTAACVAHHWTGHHDRVLQVRYRDEFRRDPAGWRFSRRRVEIRHVEEVDHG